MFIVFESRSVFYSSKIFARVLKDSVTTEYEGELSD